MLELYRKFTENFKTSHRWLRAFLKRYRFALRWHTRIFQKLLNEIQELLERFYQFVINLRIEKSYELENIFNIDKIPIWFDN